MRTFSNGRKGSVCSSLQWVNDRYQTPREWAFLGFYWQEKRSQEFLERHIIDSSMVLPGATWRRILECVMGCPIHRLCTASQWELHNSAGLINLSANVFNSLNLLKEYIQVDVLQSARQTAVDKQPQVLKVYWCFFLDDKDEVWPDLVMFGNYYIKE